MARRTTPIMQLDSGSWQVRYRDDAGRQRATTRDPATGETFRTMRAAKQFLDNTRTDLSRGQWLDPINASSTFKDYAEQWHASQVWAYGTSELVRNSLEVHLYPQIGTAPLGQLRRTQLQGVVKVLTATLAPSTTGTVVQHLRQVLNGAVADRMIASNPATTLVLPKVPPTELVIPTPDEVQAIADAIDGRHRALVVIGAGLGLRQGETFGLAVSRVDFLRRQVRIDQQLKRYANGSELGPLKTTNSYRTIPLPSWVGEEIARHIERYPSDDQDGLLFQSPQHCRLRRDGWNRRVWKPAVTAAGRPGLGYHSLRHFFASALIRGGLSAPAVAKQLGNTPAMVLSTYAHLWKDDDDRSRDAIDELFQRRVVNR